MFGCLLTFLAAVGAAVVFARESLEVSSARREGRATPETFHRFRRRTLGLTVGAVLWVFLWQLGRVEEVLRPVPVALLAYYFVCLLLAMWLLLIAGRDFRATAQAAVAETERLTLEGLEQYADALATAKEAELVKQEAAAPEREPAPAPEPPAPRHRPKVRARPRPQDPPEEPPSA